MKSKVDAEIAANPALGKFLLDKGIYPKGDVPEPVETVDDLFEELEEDDADEIDEVVETNDEVEEED